MRRPLWSDPAGVVDAGGAAESANAAAEPGVERSRAVSAEDEIAVRAAELLGVHSYGPDEEYEPAVTRLQAALGRRQR